MEAFDGTNTYEVGQQVSVSGRVGTIKAVGGRDYGYGFQANGFYAVEVDGENVSVQHSMLDPMTHTEQCTHNAENDLLWPDVACGCTCHVSN